MLKSFVTKLALSGAIFSTAIVPTISANAKLIHRDAAAKEWIGTHESHGNYHVRNGRYYGKWQLDSRYLTHGRSKAAQSKAADNYVKHRYGTWSNAKKHWLQHGWY